MWVRVEVSVEFPESIEGIHDLYLVYQDKDIRAKSIQLADPAQVPVTVTTTLRCVAGKAALATSVKNNAAEIVEVTVLSPYGSKSVSVAPGKTVSQAFSSRQVDIPAGEVTAEFSAGSNDERKASVKFDAFSCG